MPGTGFVPTVLPATPIEDLGAITFLGTRIAEQHPIVKSWNAGSPAAIPLDLGPVHRPAGGIDASGRLQHELVEPCGQDRSEGLPGPAQGTDG